VNCSFSPDTITTGCFCANTIGAKTVRSTDIGRWWRPFAHPMVHDNGPSGSEYSPAQDLKRLSELYSVDIVLPTLEGREIWLRRITKREEDQARLLNQLRLELPEQLRADSHPEM
jgi:hypothetical protein